MAWSPAEQLLDPVHAQLSAAADFTNGQTG